MKHPTLDETRSFVTELFNGVFDKSGVPYVEHLFRVEKGLPPGLSEDAHHAALLHDVLEDTDVTYYDLLNRGYSLRTVELVEGLTNDETVTYMDHMRWIANSGDSELILIKLSDNRDNSDPSRHKNFTPEDSARRMKKYAKARAILLGMKLEK